MTTLTFSKKAAFTPAAHLVIGHKNLFDESCVKAAGLSGSSGNLFKHVASGKVEEVTEWMDDVPVTFINLSTETSRNLGTVRSDLIPGIVTKSLPKEGDASITLLLTSNDQVSAAGAAIARAFPVFNEKFKKPAERKINVAFSVPKEVSEDEYTSIQRTADAIRFAALLVDKPTNYLNTSTYHEQIKEVVSKYSSVKATIFEGEDLKKEGLNAIWSVGKCATFPPLMAVLEYEPEQKPDNDELTAFVGKGIVYDSGGLSLKSGANMCTMKGDMGGSAAILAGFEALVKGKYPGRLAAVLCIAENAIGPLAYKNDDIVIPYSGKSILINNTDAEGRVVLADGVAWATKNLKPSVMLDFATLTGAQLVATGAKHAAIMGNDEDLEQLVRKAGQASGDWTFPILYAPQLLMQEFEAVNADMKNSVKDRMNAQSSCAGHFIEAHFDENWKGGWVHVDMAGPSFQKERGTGFGVALIVQVAHDLLAKRSSGRGH